MKFMTIKTGLVLGLAISTVVSPTLAQESRLRARDAGITIGTLSVPPLNAITDVAGVRVGHATLHEGERYHTGVTAVWPHEGNPYHSRVPAAVVVGNGYGKLIGALQVTELGELETPLLLTGTLSVWRAADAMVSWMLKQEGMSGVRSLNPVVGETNDGRLSDIRARPIGESHVFKALESASSGPVAEGAVGAGAGCVCFGFKGGIGTASRYTSKNAGKRWTVGALVQTNFGGNLTIAGVPIGSLLKETKQDDGDGSCMVIIATDAPIGSRNLRRMAQRALLGLARTGSVMSNGSGDFVIAFSTHTSQRRRTTVSRHEKRLDLANRAMTPLFQATVESVEEAVLNSLFMATTTKGSERVVRALPINSVVKLLKKHR